MATIDFPSSPSTGQVYTANNKSWRFGGYGWKSIASTVQVSNSALRIVYTATTNQTVFNAPAYYTQGANQVSVFIDGVRQYPNDFTESSNSAITLTTGAANGSSVMIEIGSYGTSPVVLSSTYVIDDNTSATTKYLTFSGANSGALAILNTDSTNLKYDTSTGYIQTKGVKFGDGSVQLTAGGAPNTIYNGTSNVGFVGSGGNTFIYIAGGLSTTFASKGVTVANGIYSVGNFGATYTDGIVMDYVTGTGRISVGPADGIIFYRDGVANTAMVAISNVGGLSVGTTASASNGAIIATGSITALYSDKRLKDEIGVIENALDKVDQLTGVIYKQNQLAETFGYKDYSEQVGLYAQDVEKVQPQVIKIAPFDLNDNGGSKTGENYLTVQYEKLIPLLVEAIKELRLEVKKLKGE